MGCLRETQVAGLLGGALTPSELASVDEHIDTCPECRLLVADLLRAGSTSGVRAASSGVLPSRHASLVDLYDPPAVHVGRRYRIEQLIGQGGMGRVYRARDHITGHDVALKRVLFRDPEGASLSSLAQEFRVLATLRHPNIIHVLDYGFDASRQPYFTMELLEGARPILPVAAEAPRAAQVDLLAQILRALGYLHRRRVLHRDLKPSNILLTAGGALKVVDFGLATGTGEERSRRAAGTLPYMAPELFRGAPASEASDLYAVGVVAYEMRAGRHPFESAESAEELVERVLRDEPDLSVLPATLRGVIGGALRKNPHARPRDAAALLQELRAATNVTACEPATARDSYLVAARFTGRDVELDSLGRALAKARGGRGSAWLVGGESGVGKSRLLEELRSRALVEGMLVVRGQALASGGTAFHVFHGALELLALHVPLSELEESVLGTVLPGLGALLEREVLPPPELDVAAARFRLRSVLKDVVQRSPEPVLVLLEDLQWADAESLSLLADVSAGLESLSLLVVGTYRHDEAPRLPASLPALSTLRLERLDRPVIAELCASMLGAAGEEPGLVELVARETEGNVYFIVEVMRALAEESGGLDAVARHGLPARILAGGVEQVLERRLSRVPEEARALLRLAAVAGRQLDLDLLSRLVPGLDALVQACTDAGVLEVHEERYRYNHDKLRERVLRDIAAEEHRGLHARVAAGLHDLYAKDTARAAQIGFHFREADRPAKAARFYAVAGEAALARGAPTEAQDAFEQVVKLCRAFDAPRLTEVRAWRGLAQAHYGLGRLVETDAALRQVFALARSPLPTTPRGFLLAMGRQVAEQAVRRVGLAPRLRLGRPADGEARALAEEQLLSLNVAEIYPWLARPEMAVLTTLIGLNLEEALDSREDTNLRAALAYLLSFTPLHGLSRRYLELAAATTVKGTHAEVVYLRSKAAVEINEGRYLDAAASADQAIALCRARKDDLFVMQCLFQRGVAAVCADDLAGAEEAAREMEQLAIRAENPRYLAIALLTRGGARLRLGDPASADEIFARAREVLSPDLLMARAMLVGLWAMCALMQGRLDHAEALADEGMVVAERAQFPLNELRVPLNGFLDVYLSLGQADRHLAKIRAGLVMLRRIVWEAPAARPNLLVLEGRLHFHRGHPARALASILASVRACEELGMRYDKAVALYALGCLAQSDSGRRHVPEGGERYLRKALAHFEQLGARFEADKTRAALAGRRFSPVDSPRSAWTPDG